MKMKFLPIAIFAGLLFLKCPAYAQDKSAKLKALFDTLYLDQNFNGCVLVAEEGKPVFMKAYGYADQEKKRLLDTKSVFELASISKQFTAMAIMQLKEKGLLSYEDALQKFFPGLPYKGVTIRNLLTHTSGIPEFLGFGSKDIDVNKNNFNQDIIDRFQSKIAPAQFAPGTSTAYSNTNYLLLASIVEKVSGMTFSNYMKKNVFLPAGMDHTKVYSRLSTAEKISNYASDYVWDASENSYVKTDDQPAHMTNILDGVNGPYGISSNVEDLFKWDQALYTTKLVSAVTLKDAFLPTKLIGSKGVASLSPEMPLGFGWVIRTDSLESKDMFHTGGFGGYTSLIVRYTLEKRTIILLCNYSNMTGVYELMTAVTAVLDGEQPSIPKKTVRMKSIRVAAAELKGFEGTYFFENYPDYNMQVRAEGNHLFARLTNQGEFAIYPESNDTFFYTVVEAKIKFSEDKISKQKRLTLFQNGKEIQMSQKKK
ncbi:serine hydrolase [Pedobacter caeni]|nr:serine hydrolase [Pedobacter caeni]